jgi:ribonuclease-3
MIFEIISLVFISKSNFPFCEKFIHEKIIKPYVDISRLEGKVISYKSLIIEWCQKEKKSFAFEFVEDNGIEGQKYFGVKLLINQKIIAKARATSKKKAEEKASQRAYFALQDQISQN